MDLLLERGQVVIDAGFLWVCGRLALKDGEEIQNWCAWLTWRCVEGSIASNWAIIDRPIRRPLRFKD